MKNSFELYSEQASNVTEQREGYGTLLLTGSLGLVFIDSRARKFCQDLRHAEGDRSEWLLPISLIKMCGEIKDLMQWRNHPKDWEGFAVKRVMGLAGQKIFVCGIGLPRIHDEERGILLTLDYIGARSGPRLQQAMEQFNLTRREIMVVRGLLKGWTNKEIANELNITEQTVKEHIKHIMEKTRSNTRTGILFQLSRNH